LKGEKMRYLIGIVLVLSMASCGVYTTTSSVSESIDSWSGEIVRSTDCAWVDLGVYNKICLDGRSTLNSPAGGVLTLRSRSGDDWRISSHGSLTIRVDGEEHSLEPISGHYNHEIDEEYNILLGDIRIYAESNEYAVSNSLLNDMGQAQKVDIRVSTTEGTYIMFTASDTNLFGQLCNK